MAKKQLSLILVSYNSWSWVEKCLASFTNVAEWDPDPKKTPLEVILVDNASSDGVLEQVKQKFPWVKTYALGENRGFSAGNNVGIQHASAPFIMLLNTDTEFPPQTNLLSLLDVFAEDPEIGVVTPRVELDSGEIDPSSHRGFPTPWNAMMYYSGLAKRFPQRKWAAGYHLSWMDLSTAHEIEACSGAAMIVRRTAMEEVGLLDESYFMYAEDIDWCYRFHLGKWKIWYDPRVVIIHHKHKSGLGKAVKWETKEKTIRAFYDTMKQFWRKFYTDRYPALIMIFVFAMIELLKYRKLQQERKHYENH
ncbi:glycosyltransferase family 2 protein [Candidatus Woesebacteria bacterium]|nr:glycosyltransferase family 2 protein [Candidatus Woesebacteria bacterium]MCD8507102.1 glycosyltransferase family 2 protein [Candidatus Woesebacteria bacterium]MCD8527332.1 glycosyltransferase family 2 protein [Candidatus Woesebacteria bacterium]MCD8546077.1 glycosyltransferase family 2 protein [Candidatus Woesebacteria bacterium]